MANGDRYNTLDAFVTEILRGGTGDLPGDLRIPLFTNYKCRPPERTAG